MHGSFTKRSQRTTYAEAFFFSGWLRSYLGPVVKSSNTKAKRATLRQLQETPDKKHGEMTKYYQMKSERMKNCAVGTCHGCSRLLCTKSTSKTRHLCVKCNSTITSVLFRHSVFLAYSFCWYFGFLQ